MIPTHKILSLKVELDNEIQSLETRAQNATKTEEYNNIQILLGEKERMLEKLTNLLR